VFYTISYDGPAGGGGAQGGRGRGRQGGRQGRRGGGYNRDQHAIDIFAKGEALGPVFYWVAEICAIHARVESSHARREKSQCKWRKISKRVIDRPVSLCRRGGGG